VCRVSIVKVTGVQALKGLFIEKVPPGRNVIPLRIVLKIKLASDGTIDRYRAGCGGRV
jgi:hypothetical protein